MMDKTKPDVEPATDEWIRTYSTGVELPLSVKRLLARIDADAKVKEKMASIINAMGSKAAARDATIKELRSRIADLQSQLAASQAAHRETMNTMHTEVAELELRIAEAEKLIRRVRSIGSTRIVRGAGVTNRELDAFLAATAPKDGGGRSDG